MCPSRWLTTTPRQRIVLRREMARQAPGSPVREALVREYEYDGVRDVRRRRLLRAGLPGGDRHRRAGQGLPRRAARDGAERIALDIARRYAGGRAPARAPRLKAPAGARARGQRGRPPRWSRTSSSPPGPTPCRRPRPARLPATRREGAAAVYLPACINRIFGPPDGGLSLPEALVALSERAGLPLWIPDDAPGHCCATPWTSKGYVEGGRYMAAKTNAALRPLDRRRRGCPS